MVELRDIIAPAYYGVHNSIKQKEYLEYWLKGGRGSLKSSFISIEFILNLIKDPEAHGVCFRKYSNRLETSVYNQIKWAISVLGLDNYFVAYKSPLRVQYTLTGQNIYFCGLDDPESVKSIKTAFGYIKIIWFEELNQFDGMAEIRKAKQSAIRGGNEAIVFYSYNPPPEANNWVNKEAKKIIETRLVHHSTYLTAPKEWLGAPFYIMAEELKKDNPTAYKHEYLGEEVGTGLTVFTNIELRKIPEEELKHFDNICEGIDWGYSVDPFVWIKVHYDRKYKRIYIIDEIYQVGLSNDDAIALVYKKHNKRTEIIADSEEPKSVDDFECSGLPIRGAKKGAGSINYGIKRLQGLKQIIIDPVRCPNAAREFIEYSLEQNKDGTIKSKFPDKENHCLVGDTLISTKNGLIPIKDVKVGDYVLTRKGYKKVLWSGISATDTETYTLKTKNGLSLTGTFNHKIYTNTGFRDIITLRYGDELLTIKEYKKWLNVKQLNMMENYGIDTHKRKGAAIEIIFKNVENFCTTMYGKNTTVQEKRGIIYIIKTGLSPIIKLKIWKKFHHENTWKNTHLVMSSFKNKKNLWKKSAPSQKNGTLQKKAKNGIPNMLKKWDLGILFMVKELVTFAEKHLRQKQRGRNSVQMPVNLSTADKTVMTMKQENAVGAAKNLLSTNIPIPFFVPDNVQTITCGAKENKVYDLTVEDCHEFFANGILVHNCIDSVRYALEEEFSY